MFRVMWSPSRFSPKRYLLVVGLAGLFFGCDSFENTPASPGATVDPGNTNTGTPTNTGNPSGTGTPTDADTPTESGASTYRAPLIEMTMHNGWGAYDDISVSPKGLFSKNLSYNIPSLNRQLSENEYDELITLFFGFRGLDERYGRGCADGNEYLIRLSTAAWERTVQIGCALNIQNPPDDSASIQLSRMILALSTYSKAIYNAKAPWLGLTNSVSLDRQTYLQDDSIHVSYDIINPTENTRVLYFPRKKWIRVRMRGDSRSYETPRSAYVCPSWTTGNCAATPISILPGESFHTGLDVAVSKFGPADTSSSASYTVTVYLDTPYFEIPAEKFAITVVP